MSLLVIVYVPLCLHYFAREQHICPIAPLNSTSSLMCRIETCLYDEFDHTQAPDSLVFVD